MFINTSSADSQVSNLGTDFTTATLIIYDGTPPASADASLSGNTALASHTLAGFGAPAVGVLTANAIANDVIDNTGTATFARLVLTTKTMQVTAGIGGQELVLSSTSYVAGEDSIINSLILTQPKS